MPELLLLSPVPLEPLELLSVPLESTDAVVLVSEPVVVVAADVIASVVGCMVVGCIVVLLVEPSVPELLPEPPSAGVPSSPHPIANRPRPKIQVIRCCMDP